MTLLVLPARAMLALLILGSAVYPIPGCFSVHARVVDWPGVSAFAEGDWALLPQMSPLRFHSINIFPSQNPPAFELQMPDGRWVASSQLNRDVLKPFLQPSPYREKDVYYIRYRGGYVMVVFRGGATQQVHITTNWVGKWPQRDTPALRRGDGEAEHALPATEEKLVEIFGKPTKSKNFWFTT
jgi:hypothetical protein